MAIDKIDTVVVAVALPDPKEVIVELVLKSAGVTSVIWANGFSYDFGWIHLPVFGTPARQHEDATFIAEHIARR